MNNYLVWIPPYSESNDRPNPNAVPQVFSSVVHGEIQEIIQQFKGRGLRATVEAVNERAAIDRVLHSISAADHLVIQGGDLISFSLIKTKTRILERYL